MTAAGACPQPLQSPQRLDVGHCDDCLLVMEPAFNSRVHRRQALQIALWCTHSHRRRCSFATCIVWGATVVHMGRQWHQYRSGRVVMRVIETINKRVNPREGGNAGGRNEDERRAWATLSGGGGLNIRRVSSPTWKAPFTNGWKGVRRLLERFRTSVVSCHMYTLPTCWDVCYQL